MLKTHIIREKETNSKKKTQIQIIEKIIGSKSTLPFLLLHQISMFLFRNPLVLARPIFVKVQRPLSIVDSQNGQFLVKAQYFKKLNIIWKWKGLEGAGKDKAMDIRAAETFLNVFESFFAAVHSFVGNKQVDGEFEDHFRKNNLYVKELQPHISNLLHYYKFKIINFEITKSILKLIRNDIVFFEVEGQQKMWVIGDTPSLKKQGNIQQLVSQLGELKVIDQSEQQCHHAPIFYKKNQIITRGEQTVLNSWDEQITLFDCYLDVNQDAS